MLSIFLMTGQHWLSAAESSGPDLPSWVGTVVTPVVVVFLITMGWLSPGWVTKRLEKEIDEGRVREAKLQERCDALQTGVIESTLPAVLKGTAAIEQVTPVLARITYILDTTRDQPRGGG